MHKQSVLSKPLRLRKSIYLAMNPLQMWQRSYRYLLLCTGSIGYTQVAIGHVVNTCSDGGEVFYDTIMFNIPPPAPQWARFRMNRLREAVQHIGPAAQSFRSAANAAMARPHNPLCIKALTKAFVAAYHAFSESLQAARAHPSISDATADILTRNLCQLKTEYADGLADMRADIARLKTHGAPPI